MTPFLRYMLALAGLTFIPGLLAAFLTFISADPADRARGFQPGLIFVWWGMFGLIAYALTKRRYQRWRDREFLERLRLTRPPPQGPKLREESMTREANPWTLGSTSLSSRPSS
jgi:hypothetical protein